MQQIHQSLQSIANKKQSLVQIAQIVLFHDHSKFPVPLQQSLCLNEPIIAAFSSYPIDQTLNELLQTAKCKSDDIIKHYNRRSFLIADDEVQAIIQF